MPATQTQKQILVVDRDAADAEETRRALCAATFAAHVITDGKAASAAIASKPPQLVIFDWDMPGFDSMQFIDVIRRARVPEPIRLVIVSAISAEGAVVTALESGADDYVFKPFSVRELVARVSALLRCARDKLGSRELVGGHLVLNSATYRVTAHGRLINLRRVEYRLLEFMMSHQDRAFSRDQLRFRIWGADSQVDERTVDVNVQRLRNVLSDCGCEAYLQTVRGIGYRFQIPAKCADSPLDATRLSSVGTLG